MLSGNNVASPWAESTAQGAVNMLEQVLGAYSSRLLFERSLPDDFDAADIALQVCEHPDVCTDCGLVLDEVSGVLLFWIWVLLSPSWPELEIWQVGSSR